MLDQSFVRSNCITVIFIIHHTSDDDIIEDILLRTMCTLDDKEPSVLDREETEIFADIVAAIPAEILSNEPVESAREMERKKRDNCEFEKIGEPDDVDDKRPAHVVNDAYRIMKNSEILGQILKNKYGCLERDRVAEIIETIADGGLRLVRVILGEREAMNNFAVYVHEKNTEMGIEEIRRALRILSFLWTMWTYPGFVES